MPTALDQEEEDRLAQYGPGQGYPYDTTENGPQVPPEALGAPLDNIDYGGATPLPLGTANNNYAARFGIQSYQPPGEINYSENDKSLIRRNEDERLVALGVNPAAYRKAQVEAEVQANRMQGLLGYQSARASGKSHEQAILENFQKLYANNPHQGVADASRAGALPLVTKEVNGQTLYQNGPESWRPLNSQVQAVERSISAEERKQLMDDRKQAQKDIADAYKKADLEKNQARLKAIDDQLSGSRSNALAGARGVTAPKEVSVKKEAIPFKEGAVVRNRKTGKIYKIVNGEPVEQ